MHENRSAVRTTSLAFVLLGLLVTALASDALRPLVGSAAGAIGLTPALAQESNRPREIHVVARKYAFTPQRIEVRENDLVKITMEAADIPHSFTIDDDNYRIAKRATPGHPVVFEFRADKAGTFPFYCNLTTDPGCKGMHGELVVKPRR